ncbi:hypothetical protein B0T21DRAFT_178976 [Apiosordaria backusii]|uniref:Uncharacterized protein n=1 Tax=Apiosordaria backusii TaxID=314023 RepID=A0AA40EHQ1_9PEZI|nr:hypothetical protein B0T21DRAFT_178976 [Apiosordaria backusii]
MGLTLIIREVGQILEDCNDAAPCRWRVELDTGKETVALELQDPFNTFTWTRSEQELTWYLEGHISEPFDTARADAAAESLSVYGRDLASQLSKNTLLPKHGDVHLNVVSNPVRQQLPGPPGKFGPQARSLQQLHWEVLENLEVWPPGIRFTNVTVARSMVDLINKPEPRAAPSTNRTTFKVLLVVSRPRPETDIEYQLVAKSLVAILEQVSRTQQDFSVSLTILRPPTWLAFRERLLETEYDLVHFDMKGLIRTAGDGSIRHDGLLFNFFYLQFELTSVKSCA